MLIRPWLINKMSAKRALTLHDYHTIHIGPRKQLGRHRRCGTAVYSMVRPRDCSRELVRCHEFGSAILVLVHSPAGADGMLVVGSSRK
jgi:hypothetical protein